ncbi:uncharacterized protein N7515_009186 [Penicillium bovifimosum]|uniref:C2H2-type domain-containing protein n=1 Tax=Penicillium bovifimosum TaxID=126998 RepID=A0A9W9GJ42_9EURO|nr:uncharacterized protein N7515_009186 [Penicillium bovifimosum]KAJ5121225.1 hypothetical protein N7515_009186 [Penicillium bovifimosum]
MEGLQLDWNDPTDDVLQNIMTKQDGCDLSDPKSSLPFDSSSSSLLDLGSLDLVQNDPSLMSQWSSLSRGLYYPHTSSQDAWNPLLVTGVPTMPNSHMNIPAQMPDQDCCFSQYHYSEPSENGSQYIDSYHSTDSGYGGTSCAAQSVVASSYGVDSSSPQIGVEDNTSAESELFFDRPYYGSGPSYTSEFVSSPSQLVNGSVRCDHGSCSWVGKCPSDKRKHEARHKKLFICDVPNCPRKEGFGTINDLARHKKCVHNKEPERGPKMTYMCFGSNCPRPNKRWPRLDNFKQHLNRMHHEEDGEMLLKKSMDWYEKVVRHQPGQLSSEQSSRDESVIEAQEDATSVPSNTELEPAYESTSQHTNDLFTFGSITSKPAQYGTPSVAESEPSHFAGLCSLGLSPNESSSAEPAITKPEGSVVDAADNLINAITKMVKSRGRRSSQSIDEGIEVESDNAPLSQPQRQIIQKVLSVALERLTDENDATTQDSVIEKRGWFQCDACPKQTRLRCEMKKHQKRHDRPYGCTFPHCAKSFGSKADWKRHESSQHLELPTWLCTESNGRGGAACERLFYRHDTYTQHLRQHGIAEYKVAASASNNRLDLAEQTDFWCGFCNHRVPLSNHGLAGRDERFNHIDIEHFKKGERGQDWRFPSSSPGGEEMDRCEDEVLMSKDTSRKSLTAGQRKRKFALV